jgi:hypothetical protein
LGHIHYILDLELGLWVDLIQEELIQVHIIQHTLVQGGGNWYTSSNYLVTESFSLRNVKDIEINTTNIVNAWYSSSLPNYGFLVKLTGSLEFNSSEYVQPHI